MPVEVYVIIKTWLLGCRFRKSGKSLEPLSGFYCDTGLSLQSNLPYASSDDVGSSITVLPLLEST